MKKTVLHGRPDFRNPTKAYDDVVINDVFKLCFKILKPEKAFYTVTIIYGIAIALLTLAAPISVQTLIGTVANTALAGPVITLAVILFILLSLSGVMNAIQIFVMELFERRFFARITKEISLQNIYAQTVYFKTINRAELTNRYFDIMTVQKNMPHLVIGGFALILQTVVGLIVVSFYHPALFLFNIIFVVAVYFVWRIWGHQAIRSSLALSSAKYNVARWLEELARDNADFKTSEHIMYALGRSEKVTADYINSRKVFFGYSFSQMIAFLFLYAFFSASLLGLGGLLVISGQLTLGQLVAAELILTAIFFGISQAGFYLGLLYELLPAIEKISHFFRIPTENVGGRVFHPDTAFPVSFKKVSITYRDKVLDYDFDLPAGAKIMAGVTSGYIQEYFLDLLYGYREPDQGHVFLNNIDISDLDAHSYRHEIAIIDSPMLLEGTIEEYLKFSNADVSKADITAILKILKLDDVIQALPNKLQTDIIYSGYPLSASETVRLKLAATLLSKPKILILTEIFDVIGYYYRQDIFEYLCSIEDLTLLYFTNRRDADYFNSYLYLTQEDDLFTESIDEFRSLSRPHNTQSKKTEGQ